MCGKYHPIGFWRSVSISALLICFAFTGQTESLTVVAQNEGGFKSENAERVTERSSLPTSDQLVNRKLEALKAKLSFQNQGLANAEFKLFEEQNKTKSVFDNDARFQLSIVNTAPSKDYRLDWSEIYLDGKLFARGGKRNKGLPRKAEVFFGPITPGCHELSIKMHYVRLKNDLVHRFKVNRVENVILSQAFIAKNGYQIDIEIEGYEAHNTFFNFYRGPAVRFNKSVRPNFLPEPFPNLNKIFAQGRVHIDYVTEDSGQHELIRKSFSIDGMPVLVNETESALTDKSLIYDGSLNEGRHTLQATLVFGEKKMITGGPLYNFRLTFNRDFYVIGGQTTIINLAGMPKDGFERSPENSRYARARTRIVSENLNFFPENCKESAVMEGTSSKTLESSPAESAPPFAQELSHAGRK